MKGKKLKKVAAWLLTATMITTLVPVMNEPVQAKAAEETQITESISNTKTITGLGVDAMADPVNPDEDMTVKLPKKKFKAYKKLLVKKGVSKKAKFQKKQ